MENTTILLLLRCSLNRGHVSGLAQQRPGFPKRRFRLLSTPRARRALILLAPLTSILSSVLIPRLSSIIRPSPCCRRRGIRRGSFAHRRRWAVGTGEVLAIPDLAVLVPVDTATAAASHS